MKRHAFTLVELLVVIAIIGLLSTVAVVATSSSRAKARDSKRLADLKQIRTAVELYIGENDIYPSCVGAGGGCYSTPDVANFGTMQAIPTYLPKAPLDPINVTGAYGYYYITRYVRSDNCTYVWTGKETDYILTTRLENPNAVTGSCPAGFSAFSNSVLNYLVGS